MIWKTSRRTLNLGLRPLTMGILNLTPDSFSDGSLHHKLDEVIERARQMESLGADILDLGAESTRPGASPVPLEEEWSRLEPVLKRLQKECTIPLSVDTYKPEIVRRSTAYGVEIVNDVSGGQWEHGLWEAVAEAGAGYVLTHSQGKPPSMQENPRYANIVEEVTKQLQQSAHLCQKTGINREAIVVDPGIGFGKDSTHNWTLLAGLNNLKKIGVPILVGVSRKTFLKKIAGEQGIEVSTTATQVWASSLGADIWRVHDVSAAMAAARVVEQLRKAGTGDN